MEVLQNVPRCRRTSRDRFEINFRCSGIGFRRILKGFREPNRSKSTFLNNFLGYFFATSIWNAKNVKMSVSSTRYAQIQVSKSSRNRSTNSSKTNEIRVIVVFGNALFFIFVFRANFPRLGTPANASGASPGLPKPPQGVPGEPRASRESFGSVPKFS